MSFRWSVVASSIQKIESSVNIVLYCTYPMKVCYSSGYFIEILLKWIHISTYGVKTIILVWYRIPSFTQVSSSISGITINNFLPPVYAIFLIIYWYFKSGNHLFLGCWTFKYCTVSSRHKESNISKHRKHET